MSESPHAGPTHGVAAVLLAAGRSRRLGQTKQLLPWAGEPLVRRAASMLLRTSARPVIAVLGHRAADVDAALGDLPLKRMHNPRFADGQSTSVAAGVRAVPEGCRAALFAPCDQPHLRARSVEALIQTSAQHPRAILRPVYDGRLGAPVLFPAEYFDELLHLQGDEGGRQLLRRYRASVIDIPIPDAVEGVDIDTAHDLASHAPPHA